MTPFEVTVLSVTLNAGRDGAIGKQSFSTISTNDRTRISTKRVGDATPLAGIAHDIPVYGLLRIPARHAFEWTFAIAVLAGYGATAIAHSRARSAHVIGAFAIVVLVGGVAYAMLLAGHPDFLSLIVRCITSI